MDDDRPLSPELEAMIEKGEAEAAKELILTLAPALDPDAVDGKGRPVKHPEQSMSHLRARARVYQALKEWKLALADADAVCKRQLKMDADMSRRSDQVEVDEALRDELKEQVKE